MMDLGVDPGPAQRCVGLFYTCQLIGSFPCSARY